MKIRVFILIVLAAVFVPVLVACGGGETAAPSVEEIDLSGLAPAVNVETVFALQGNPDVFMLDVREPDEFAAGHIPGITLIPMGEVADRMSEIPKDQEVIVTCRSGNRSAQIADFLRAQGYTNVHNMEGGILAWEEAGYPVEQ